MWFRRREVPPPQMPLPAEDFLKLAWLADAPLFIDAEQVAAFYDAVVRPEAEQKKITLSLRALESEKTTLTGEANATISIAKWVTTIFPFLDATIEGKGAAAFEDQRSKETSRTIEFQPIKSPQRQLVQLAFHYALQLPHRLKIVADPSDPTWYATDFVQALPRALVLLDFKPNTAFIPMAMELDKGRVVPVHEQVAKSFTGDTQNPNQQPDDSKLDEPNRQAAWRQYWRWYADHFVAQKALETVEEMVRDGGRIRWIDFRVPILRERKTLHLHVCGHGEYDTGVFAYNLVKRGFKHGLRLVGTLKSEPDVNVLAILEK